MLIAIERLLKERGTMSLRDLAIHFEADADAMEAMLEQLIRKDRVRKSGPGGESCSRRCGGCEEACGAATVFYESC